MSNRLNATTIRARVERIVVGSSRLMDTVFGSANFDQRSGTFHNFLRTWHRITHLKPLKFGR